MAAELVYSAEEEAAQKEWDNGLFACCSDHESCRFCIMSCFCPGVSYAINFNSMTGDGPYAACVTHTCVDVGMLTELFNIFSLFMPYAPLPPIACCLRYTHRRAAADGRERAGMSMLKETFCWPCSLTQVRKEFSQNTEEKKKKIAASSDLLGTLGLVRNMRHNMEPPV
jgi:Cys-rich protein (TIGR01571 family)